jgi:hypothetical protein
MHNARASTGNLTQDNGNSAMKGATPGMSSPGAQSQAGRTGGPFDRDRFLMRQKLIAIDQKYLVYDESGREILFIRRQAHLGRNLLALLAGIATAAAIIGVCVAIGSVFKSDAAMIAGIATGATLGIVGGMLVGVGLSAKRHIEFHASQASTTPMVTILQDNKWVFLNATYTAADDDLNLLGWFRKNYLYDVFRKRWYLYGPSGELVCVAMEDSVARSILRRVLGQYGAMIITNFVILGPDMTTKLGEFNRKFTILDKYVLDLTADGERTVDRRLALALGVLLDTGERR